jgi:hypothetical protein
MWSPPNQRCKLVLCGLVSCGLVRCNIGAVVSNGFPEIPETKSRAFPDISANSGEFP